MFSGDSSLEQIQRGGEALVCLFGEMDEFVGSPDEVLGLSGEAVTLAWVVCILSWMMSEEIMFFIICL